jgi:CheY-like chemotaxis protein
MAHDGRPRVLVADDDAGIRTALRALLEADGFAVTEVADGRAAVAELSRGGVDLAILDLAMPCLDGLEVLRELRRAGGDGGGGGAGEAVPPVLILTAYDSTTAAAEAARCGAFAFLRKPITPETLRAAVRGALASTG